MHIRSVSAALRKRLGAVRCANSKYNGWARGRGLTLEDAIANSCRGGRFGKSSSRSNNCDRYHWGKNKLLKCLRDFSIIPYPFAFAEVDLRFMKRVNWTTNTAHKGQHTSPILWPRTSTLWQRRVLIFSSPACSRTMSNIHGTCCVCIGKCEFDYFSEVHSSPLLTP